MAFRVTNCTVTTNSITITFSDTVLTDNSANNGANLANYAVFARNSVDFTTSPPPTIQDVKGSQPASTKFSVAATAVTVNKTNDSITLTFTPSAGKNEFQAGDFVHVQVSNVQSSSNESIHGGLTGGEVQGRISRVTRDVEDAISYPILTEEIGYRSSPVGVPTGGGSFSGGGGGNLGQVAAKTVSDVLGWKTNTADPKGFVGALTQAFTLTEVEGHVESTWTPRTYAVQTDLGGGITGAQASLYMRAKNALDSALPLLNGLYPLDPEADPEYVKALREMARSQMAEIVKELGVVGLPSILRIDTYFEILLGQNPAQTSSSQMQFDPDQIEGTLGELRDTYGIKFTGNKFNNSVEDEQDITNFRVISDYMTSLMQSWIANRQFFFVRPKQPAFFGTQLVLISRQFTTIAETVNEVRFALDSVFIGPSERQTLLLKFTDTSFAPMFLEDVLCEIEKFATEEGPRLLRDGGKISVTNNILPVVRSLRRLVELAHAPLNRDALPDGFKTARVRNSLDDLQDQLRELIQLIEQIKQEVPLAEDELTLVGVVLKNLVQDPPSATISALGTAFDLGVTAEIHSSAQTQDITWEFVSAQRIDVTFDPTQYATGNHDLKITNPDGESKTLTDAFSISGTSGNIVITPKGGQLFQFGKPVGAPPAGTGLGTSKSAAQKAPANAATTTTAAANAATANAAIPNTATLRKSIEELEKKVNENHKKIEEQLQKGRQELHEDLDRRLEELKKLLTHPKNH